MHKSVAFDVVLDMASTRAYHEVLEGWDENSDFPNVGS